MNTPVLGLCRCEPWTLSSSLKKWQNTNSRHVKTLTLPTHFQCRGMGLDFHDLLHMEWLHPSLRRHLLGHQPSTKSLVPQSILGTLHSSAGSMKC